MPEHYDRVAKVSLFLVLSAHSGRSYNIMIFRGFLMMSILCSSFCSRKWLATRHTQELDSHFLSAHYTPCSSTHFDRSIFFSDDADDGDDVYCGREMNWWVDWGAEIRVVKPRARNESRRRLKLVCVGGELCAELLNRRGLFRPFSSSLGTSSHIPSREF